MSDVTQILSRLEKGESTAANDLLPLVYAELRKLAAARLVREQANQSLQPTVLVHEAYLRLVDVDNRQSWTGRGHFFGAAAEAMRRILVEHARKKQTQKRGGDRVRVELQEESAVTEGPTEDILDLDQALSRLHEAWPEQAELVKLRYFAGLTLPEVSRAMGISLSTAERYWRFARVWLFSQLSG